jgi:hypothetical protein
MKTNPPQPPPWETHGRDARATTRREFVRTAVRMVWLGGIVTVGAVLARRVCHARGTCQNCPVLAECALPWRKARNDE